MVCTNSNIVCLRSPDNGLLKPMKGDILIIVRVLVHILHLLPLCPCANKYTRGHDPLGMWAYLKALFLLFRVWGISSLFMLSSTPVSVATTFSSCMKRRERKRPPEINGWNEDNRNIHFVLDAAVSVPSQWGRRAVDQEDFRGHANHRCSVFSGCRWKDPGSA